ncbi:FAD/NAD(P)-binding protein [Streptomyces sp. NPDC013455]|uniref:FAD/NAD(P)-binding protein n=1 Tax=Streptomyces sp. NPDC013455 TaxID=3155605 RepID=UPI0033E8D297
MHDRRPSGRFPHRIAVIGSGPRGLSVVERLAARLLADPPAVPVDIHLIDPVEVGTGRVWRTDQPMWFLMNTIAGEVSAFSGRPDGGPVRPGAGPSLAEWWQTVDPEHADPLGYAPRAVYGRYMQYVLGAVEAGLPERVRLHRTQAEVTDLEPGSDGYLLTFDDGRTLTADRVVITTGHTRPELSPDQQRLADFAAAHPGLHYYRGDSAADMALDEIPAGATVGILGLGLSFYDVMAALTEGRGGRFETGPDGPDGALRYVPSGREPLLVAGSRSSMPLPGRGRHQKDINFRYATRLFTTERIRRSGDAPVRFRTEAWPWLRAEMDLVYYATGLRRTKGEAAAEAFTADVVAAAEAGVPDVRALAARHGGDTLPPLDIDALARPFAGREYPDPEAFTAEVVAAVHADLEHAEEGNVDSPLKAALDVLRDTRAVIRDLVDFGGLAPDSHRDEFLEWFVPRTSFLAAGPPRIRLRQVIALIEAGVLRLAGPETRYETDPEGGTFAISSPWVRGSRTAATAVVDARIPTPALHRDPAPLTRALVERGVLTSYVNGSGPDAFDTGGVAVTHSPFHPVGRTGRPDHGLYVLGIPTEHTRWFMQGGSSRPGFWTDFIRDADAIAGDALAPVAEATRAALLPAAAPA